MSENSYISRKEAAELLRISLRSVDRYIREEGISALRRGRELYMSKADILSLKDGGLKRNQKGGRPLKEEETREFEDIHKAQVIEQTQTREEEKSPEIVDKVDILDVGFAKIRDSLLRRSPEEGIFKALYEKTELEMKELRGRLDAAHYRVGGLEAQIRSMVPMIAFKRQKKELLLLEEKARTHQKKLDEMKKQLRIEQFIKKVYAGFLFLMLAMVPILVILRILSL